MGSAWREFYGQPHVTPLAGMWIKSDISLCDVHHMMIYPEWSRRV